MLKLQYDNPSIADATTGFETRKYFLTTLTMSLWLARKEGSFSTNLTKAHFPCLGARFCCPAVSATLVQLWIDLRRMRSFRALLTDSSRLEKRGKLLCPIRVVLHCQMELKLNQTKLLSTIWRHTWHHQNIRKVCWSGSSVIRMFSFKNFIDDFPTVFC